MSSLVMAGAASVIFAAVVLFAMRRIIGGAFGLYRVVQINEAHVRVMNGLIEVFSARGGSTAYWYIPFITKVSKLPLTNLSIPVKDIKLNDKEMAKFHCDLVCFVNIKDPKLAAERLTPTETDNGLGFDDEQLAQDVRAIVESIGRTATTQTSLTEVYRDRKRLDDIITKEVQLVFPKWGLELVNLELIDLKDMEGSTIIEDMERQVAADIRRNAEIKIAQANRDIEIQKAESVEAYTQRQIQKDKNLAVAEEKKNLEVALQAALANEKAVEAQRVIETGKAKIAYEVQVKNSEANAFAVTTAATAEADRVYKVKEADARGTEKMAEALKKFDDKALSVKQLDIYKAVNESKFASLAQALSKANVKLILSGANAQKFFGLNLNAEGGANLEQFLEEMNASGIDPVEKLKEIAGTAATAAAKVLK